MVYSSSNISGLIGGQMAMFSNQASFSQQIGGQMGGGISPLGMAGMQNPFPQQSNIGSQVVGGAATAMPTAMMGASMGAGAASMLPGMGAMAMADPIGMGLSAGYGGMMGGGSMLGRAGMAAGGAAAFIAPAAGAAWASHEIGQNVYQGAQSVADVRGMSAAFGDQTGQAGAQGNQMGRQNIKGIVSALGDLVGEDTQATMGELKKVMDQAGRMGMLTGISDPQQFKKQFGGIVKQVREIADVLGSSMEEALPMMNQMKQMGLWKGSDVMGTVMSAKVSGTAAPQLVQTMQQGAQLSHAMGGNMRSGAVMGRESFMTIQAARRAGVLSQEDVSEFTGGMTGARGQQAIAQRMTGIMSSFSQSSAGRLMMAGLGETEDGVFTGNIDKEKLSQFNSGELSVNDLQRMGKKSARSKEGKMSFFRQAGKMGQELGAQGGMESMAKIVQQVADTNFGGSEQARHQLFQQMLGVSSRDAEMLGKLADKQPQVRDQKMRELEVHINQTFADLERKQQQGWSGVSDAAEKMWQDQMRPIQEFGSKLATNVGSMVDQISDKYSGRMRRTPMGGMERTRLLQSGALSKDLSGMGLESMGSNWVEGGGSRAMLGGGMSQFQNNLSMRMRETGFGGELTDAFSGKGGSVARQALGYVPIAGAAMGGIQAMGVLGGVGAMTPRAQKLRDIGIGTAGGSGGIALGEEGGQQFTTSQAEIEYGVRRAYMRAETPTRKALGVKDGDKVEKVKSKLNTIIGQNSKRLSELKKKNPKAYQREVIRLLKKGDNVLDGLDEKQALDYVAVSMEESGFGEGDLQIDFKGSANVGGMPTTPDELAEYQNEKLSEMASAASGVSVEGGAMAMSALGVLNPLGGILGMAAGAVYGMAEEAGTEEKMRTALEGPGAGILSEFLRNKDSDPAEALASLHKIKGSGAAIELIQDLSSKGRGEDLKKVRASFGGDAGYEASRMLQVQQKGLSTMRGAAARGPASARGLRGKTGEAFSDLVGLYRGGDNDTLDHTEYAQAVAESEALAGTLTKAEYKALSQGKGGAVGRQVAGFKAISGKGAMGKEGLADLKATMSGLGYSMGGKAMEEFTKDDEITKDEAPKFQELLKKIVSTGMAEDKKSRTDQMMEQLRMYTESNTRFVNAVKGALGEKLPKGADEVAKKSAGVPEENK